MTFTLRLSSSAGSAVTVQASTDGGTALSPSDYAATSAVVTFPAGTTTQTFQVSVNGDAVPEPNETFSVKLAQPVGVTASATPGIGTIVNDDAQPPPEGGFTSAAELSGSDGTVDGTKPKTDGTP